MTETNGPAGPEQPAETTPDETPEGPRRVVGTPPPAQARALLIRPEDEEKPPPERDQFLRPRIPRMGRAQGGPGGPPTRGPLPI